MIRMTPKLVVQALLLAGWELDKYKHPCKQVGQDFLRVRALPQHCLVERRVRRIPTNDDLSRTGWKEVVRTSYAEVGITEACQVRIGHKLF